MKDIEFISEHGRDLLRHHQLDSFESLWQFEEGNWFEALNYRRGGWSGVSRTELKLPDGSPVGLFIKRQENHVYRSWQNWFRPMATFEREFRNILAFQKEGIPTLEVVYFGQRRVCGKLRAILITRALTGYQDFESWMTSAAFSRDVKAKVFRSLAMVIKAMHMRHFQHNCLYPKHIFIREQVLGKFDIRLIDLEKAKRWPFKRNASLRDLSTLNRHTHHLSKTDRLRLFLAYRQEKCLSTKSKEMISKLSNSKKSKSSASILDQMEKLPTQLLQQPRG